MQDVELREMAIPGMHERIIPVLRQHVPSGSRVLDLGAGEGAFSRRLTQAGYLVSACDLRPDQFRCPGVECRRVDVEHPLPYADNHFDAVIAVEVVEHLESHLPLFRETARILAPNGCFLFTTPNIASLKSRLLFLLTGYFYSHGPLDPQLHDPVSQHITAFTPDRYRFILARAGLRMEALATDKHQRTSRLLRWMAPLIRWSTRRCHGTTVGTTMANSPAALYGRTLIGISRKRAA